MPFATLGLIGLRVNLELNPIPTRAQRKPQLNNTPYGNKPGREKMRNRRMELSEDWLESWLTPLFDQCDCEH